jgi:dephospho-CoA kinase
MPLIIGVFGMIGCGKTTVAKIIEKKYGYLRIDSDVIGHSLLENDEVKKDLLPVFGSAIVTKDGLIDRKELSHRVFADLYLKSKLEAIIWPKMTIKIQELMDQKRDVVLEAAILFLAGWNKLCHYTIYIEAPVQKQIHYLKDRHIANHRLTNILDSQQDIQIWKDLATYRIENSGTRDELEKKVLQVMSSVQERGMEKDEPKEYRKSDRSNR